MAIKLRISSRESIGHLFDGFFLRSFASDEFTPSRLAPSPYRNGAMAAKVMPTHIRFSQNSPMPGRNLMTAGSRYLSEPMRSATRMMP